MSDNKENVPKIRFPGFTDAWEQRRFEELVTRVSKSSDRDVLPRVEYEDIISGQGEFKKDIFAKRSDKKGIEFEVGDTLFGKLRPYLQNWLLADFKGIAVGDWWVLRPKEMDSKFIYSLIQSNKYQMVANLSTGTKMPRSDWKVVSQTEFAVPTDKDEQAKIGDLFRDSDHLISLHQRKLNNLQNLKAGLLQKMFSKDGEDFPEVRFPGFTDAWEQHKFSDVTFLAGEKNKDNLPLESYSITNENGFIPQNEQFENGGTMRDADKRMYYIVSPNSFAYNPARINVGSIGYQNLSKSVIVSSLYEVFKTTDIVDDKFLWHWFKSDAFQKRIEQYQEGGVRLYFYYNKLCMCSIALPSILEQRKIGQYLDTFDHLVTLHQRKLEHLQQQKKALLQQMFV